MMKTQRMTFAAAMLAAAMTCNTGWAAEPSVKDASGVGDAQPAAARDSARGGQEAAGRSGGDAVWSKSQQQMSPKEMAQDFVKHAAIGGMFEVQVAQIAQQRAQSQEVKQFAQMLQQDHQQANQQLMQAAQSAGVEVPKQLDEVHQAKLQMMQQMQGAHFEKHFVYGQIGHHTVDMLMFRDASQELQDPQLKQFASQTLPKLQQHLQQLRQMAGMSGMGSGGDARPASSIEQGSGHKNHDAQGSEAGGGKAGKGGKKGAKAGGAQGAAEGGNTDNASGASPSAK